MSVKWLKEAIILLLGVKKAMPIGNGQILNALIAAKRDTYLEQGGRFNMAKKPKQLSQTTYKLDNIKKEKFVLLYRAPESGGNISIVCDTVGIARQTYYDWLEKDEAFRKAMYDAKMEQCDAMEQALYQRGYEKDTTALIFWLKMNHPTYKEKPQVLIQQNFVQKVEEDRDKYQ